MGCAASSINAEKPFNYEVFVNQNGEKGIKYHRASWVWPNSTVYYYIDPSLLSNKEIMKRIKTAIQRFHSLTCIKFVSISQDDNQVEDYLVLQYHENETNSYVGRIGGPQIVNIADWAEVGVIQHELMHALGFVHEHCRVDRDGYVRFNDEANTSVDKENYEKCGYPLGSYDAQSLMHYSLCEYMQSDHEKASQMGQRCNFSRNDIKGINYVYGEPKCTYEYFKDQYYVQTFYECLTCWGPNTCFGVCEHCYYYCHKDHEVICHPFTELIENGNEFICDCGRQKHQMNACTKQTTGKNQVRQSKYVCYDCYDVEKQISKNKDPPGICINCWKNCHQSHNSRFYEYSENFACKCDYQWWNCNKQICMAKRSVEKLNRLKVAINDEGNNNNNLTQINEEQI